VIRQLAQPAMDQGIENMISIALFTLPDWPGNILISDENRKLGSKFQKIANQTITVASLNNLENAALNALRFMIKTKVASDIKVRASNPSGNNLRIIIGIQPPGGDLILFVASKVGINWQLQKMYPAHERL
jgi:phage gp46-like protein